MSRTDERSAIALICQLRRDFGRYPWRPCRRRAEALKTNSSLALELAVARAYSFARIDKTCLPAPGRFTSQLPTCLHAYMKKRRLRKHPQSLETREHAERTSVVQQPSDSATALSRTSIRLRVFASSTAFP